MKKRETIVKGGWAKRTSLIIALVISMGLLVFAFSRFAAQNKWLDDELAMQTHHLEIENEITELSFYIKEAESENRGYAVTGDKVFVKNFDLIIDSIRSTYLRLQQLENHRDSELDAASFLQTDSLVTRKIAFMQQVKRFCDDNDFKAARDLIATTEGMRLTDSIAKINNRIVERLDAKLDKSHARFLKVNAESKSLSYFSIIGSMLLVVLIFYFLLKEIQRTRKMGEVLQLQKEKYRITLNSLGEGMISTDNKGLITYMNPVAEQLTGWNWREAKLQPLHHVFDVTNEDTGLHFENVVDRILSQGKVISLENNTILRSKNDGDFIISNNGSPIFDINGNIAGAVLVFNDVSEKYKTEKALQQSETHLRSIFENTSNGILLCDKEFRIVEFNSLMAQTTKISMGISLQKNENILDLLPPKRKEKLQQYAARVLMGEKVNYEAEYLLGDGNTIFFNVNINPIWDVEGKVAGGCIEVEDITERKKAEQAIKDSEEKFRSLFEQAAEGIFLFDLRGNIVSVNSSGCRMLGYDNDELLSMTLFDLMPPEFAGKMPIDLSKVNERSPQLVERQIKHKDGSIFLTEVSVQLLADRNIQVIVRDITERKKAEAALIASEKELRTMAESMPQIVWTTRADGWNIYFNQQWVDYTGLTLEESYGHGWNKPFHPDDQQKAWDAWQNTVTNLAEYNLECRLRKYDGTYHWWLIRGVPQIGDNGEIVKWHGTCTDIENIKQQEEIIKKEKELSDSIINSLPGVFYFYDENLKMIRWNKQFEIVTGYTATEIRFKKITNFFQNGDTEYMQERIRKVFASGGGDAEVNFTSKTGKKIPFYFTGLRIQYESRPCLLGIGIDITERRNAELLTKKAIERYDILADATSDTIWDWDLESNTMMYNDGISKMFGYKTSEITDLVDWWNENLHPDDLQKVTESLQDVFEKGLQRFQLTYRFRCADGSYKHVFDRAFVVFNENNQPSRMIGAMQDITYQVEEEMRISKAFIDAQEQERNWLGAELHDNINQILAGTLLTLDIAKSKKIDKKEQTGFITNAMEYITNAINETRKLSHELVPVGFEDNSLMNLFETLLQNMNLENLFAFKLDFDELKETDIPENIQVALYRILQEQTKNILKYSEASTVEVSLKIIGDNVTLRIFDNGVGFDTKAKKNGIGLNNIKKRAESLSGKLILKSAPGKGCEIIVEIPIGK